MGLDASHTSNKMSRPQRECCVQELNWIYANTHALHIFVTDDNAILVSQVYQRKKGKKSLLSDME